VYSLTNALQHTRVTRDVVVCDTGMCIRSPTYYYYQPLPMMQHALKPQPLDDAARTAASHEDMAVASALRQCML